LSAPSIKSLSTGCAPLDQLMGGLSTGEMVLLFGERGSGKTTLAFQMMVSAASRGLSATMLYTEGRAPLQRLTEIAGPAWQTASELMWVMEVKSFGQQDALIDDIESQMPQKTALLVLDSITSCYRAELGQHDANISINKALNRETALLKDLCIRKGLTVLLISEVRTQLNGQGIEPVASAILTYWADRAFRMDKVYGDLRKVTQIKPPSERDALIKLKTTGFSESCEV
jgi:DNA repair protein RadB